MPLEEIVAESLIMHFSSATLSDVFHWLDQRLGREVDGHWCIAGQDLYYVLIYGYSDYEEFAPEELEQLGELLGAVPSCGLCLELRRSAGRMAHDYAAEFAVELLREFSGVLGDIGGEIYWTLADLEDGAAMRAGELRWPDA